ncbi:MAG: AAA family ATPase [Betaproteobacteria bacterium]|nr:AAA family ATPase [Betaproteobacteria bacterium]
MNCSRCRHDNPATAKFCVECGAPLARSCARCGAALPPAAKFCPECAHPVGATPEPATYTPRHLAERILDSRAALEGERKQVTVLFADLKGSMELLADRDPEEARKLLDPVLERMMAAVHHYEGTVNQVMGDGIMALFGAPLAHEDHAVRGCYAALRMQEAIRRYTEEVRRAHGIEVQIRVGLNSGEVVVRSIGSDLRMDYTAVGQTTHLAARMEQLATPGTIRLTANTLALAEGYVEVKGIGPVPVKGLAEPVEVYELAGAGAARTRLQAARARGLTRFVGRDTELDQLRRAADETHRGRGRIVAVVGEPGVGKSRLYYEFIHSHHVQDWLVLESGSVSYGKATPYLPLADLLRSYFKIDARDDIRGIRVKVTGGLLTLDDALKDTVPVALWLLDALPEDSAFLTLEPAERRRQTLAAVKRLLLRENQVHPMMLVFEDLHWIDGETQAFLDSLVESLPASRILLAVNYRPEYRHGWANKTYYCQLHIDPLPPESAEHLLDALVGRDPSTESLKQFLIERTAGSPLFLEESVRTLVETRALVGERSAYRLVRAPDTLQVPATVQAIIAARIDRLGPEEKRLLQAAAVVGTHVPFTLLRAIAEVDEEALRQCLATLQTAEFVYEAQLFPEFEFAFKHALTHEVAYGSVLQDRRRALHAAIVEAIERLYADRLSEQIERLAHHAVRGRILPKAVRYLSEAGSKAISRSANREAVAYFEEALALIDELPQTTESLNQALEIRMALGPALIAVKGPSSTAVENLYSRALELVDQLGADASRFPALWGLWFVNYTRGCYADALTAGERLLDAARNGDDTGQLLEAHHSLWPTLTSMGRPLQAISHMEEGLAIYDRDRHGAYAFLYAGHDPGACCRWHLAMNRWLVGYPDRALEHLQDACRLADELKHPQTTVIALWYSAWVQCQRGERESALANIERMIALAEAHGISSWRDVPNILMHAMKRERTSSGTVAELHQQIASLGTTASRKVVCLCVLAELCAEWGYADEGLQALRSIPEEHRMTFSAPEILRLEGELLLRQKQPLPAEAEHRFGEAIGLARTRGEKSLELRAATSFARLLEQQGRREEAHATLAPVYGWFTEGFDTADLKVAKALLDTLA